MRTCLTAALLFLLVSSAAFGDDKKLQDWLAAGSWAQGVEYCNRELMDEVARRPDLRSLSAVYLSRVATYCAALASGKGDEVSSGWWWYTAAALDFKTAQGLLPELQKKGLLQKLPAPRSRVSTESHQKTEKDKVRLLSGETVPGTPPKPVVKPKVPDFMYSPISGVSRAVVAVELVVTRDGLPQQPLLLTAQALPVHVLFAYRFFSAWRFEPAKVNNEPVDCVYTVTVTTQRGV